LDDPQGFREAGYKSVRDRLRIKANNPTNFYIKSRGFKGKENMGRREPRDVERTNIVEETNIGLRKRKQKRFVQASLMRKKRFSNIAMGMVSLAHSQVLNAFGTGVLSG